MITAVSSKSDNSAEDKQRVDKLNNAVAEKVGSLKLFGGQLRKVAAITHNEQSICGGHNAVAVNIARKDSACGFILCNKDGVCRDSGEASAPADEIIAFTHGVGRCFRIHAAADCLNTDRCAVPVNEINIKVVIACEHSLDRVVCNNAVEGVFICGTD